MNLKRVRTFMMVVDLKNFSTVADMLGISQPAVSKQIKTLEEELGAVLLYRETLEPTEAGRLVYRRGKDLLQAWDDLIEDCRALQGQLTGILQLGTSTIPSVYLAPAILKQFRSRYPHIEVRLSSHNSEETLQLLREGKLDAALIGSKPPGEPFLSHLIATDRLQLVGPADSPDFTALGDLRDLPFISRKEGSGTWQAIREGLTKWGVRVEDLKTVAQVDSTESVISMVEAGLGYSIVSSFAAAPATCQNRVKVLAELPVEREFYLAYSVAKRQSPLIGALVNLLLNE